MDFREINEFFKDTFQYFIFTIIILLVIVYVIAMQQVVGPSMQPTLNDGNIVLLNKAFYNFFDVKRYDIISFEYADTKYLVKRVIGLPGEMVEYKDGVLLINGKAIDDEYAKITDDFSLSKFNISVIPDDQYLVLGDNRTNSLDGRKIGLISKDKIIGKVVFRIWPTSFIK